jgi:hypothetical protein
MRANCPAGLGNRVHVIARCLAEFGQIQFGWVRNYHCPSPWEEAFPRGLPGVEFIRTNTKDSTPTHSAGFTAPAEAQAAAFRHVLSHLAGGATHVPAVGILHRLAFEDGTIDQLADAAATAAAHADSDTVFLLSDQRRHEISAALTTRGLRVTLPANPAMSHEFDRARFDLPAFASDWKTLLASRAIVSNSPRSSLLIPAKILGPDPILLRRDRSRTPRPERYAAVGTQTAHCFDYPETYDDIADALPDGGVFVELGVLHGRSLAYMAEALQLRGKRCRLYGIDLFRDSNPLESVWRDLLAIDPAIRLIQSDSAEAATLFPPGSVDAVFVDACHTQPAVTADVTAWLPRLTLSGIMAGHDYMRSGCVRRALRLLALPIRLQGDCWIRA